MSFWELHGYFGGLVFILFLLFLPRLTMIFSVSLSAIAGTWVTTTLGLDGFFGVLVTSVITVLGWILCIIYPRHLIAALATAFYWSTNPLLMLGIWVIAFQTLKGRREFIKQVKEKIEERIQEQEASAKKEWNSTHSHRKPAPTRTSTQTWWQVLEVSPSASREVVKSAYRQAVKRFHPDVARDGGDPEKFRHVTEAYRDWESKNKSK